MDRLIDEAVDVLREEHPRAVEVQDRTIRLVEQVKGDPGLTVLRVLGVAQAASPVGAAARSAVAVAAGVWRKPELYVARWLNGRRWIVGYRLAGDARIIDYVRSEGRVPTRFETGHWYASAPDALTEAFFDAGILLDDPPFPVVVAPRRPQSPATGASPVSRPPRPARRPGPTTAPVRTSRAADKRLCPSCRMHKAEAQFVAGSEYCVDCR